VQTKAEHGVVAAFCRMHRDALKAARGALATGLVPDLGQASSIRSAAAVANGRHSP
jgi:hypothetical protein